MGGKRIVRGPFTDRCLTVEETTCRVCGGALRFRKDRIHPIYTLDGPLKLICHQQCCANRHCSQHERLITPAGESEVTMPRWIIGWDVFLWMGFRRYKRHWSLPQLQAELLDSYQIALSRPTLSQYLRKYQLMVAAYHQDVERLRTVYRECADLILTIDGIQPEKGHETVYVVRELRQPRVWFAEPVLSSTTAEIQKLIRRAKQIAEQVATPVCGWMSDKQEAFVAAIAREFPGTPHRFCANHFLRDAAQLMLEVDSQAKVQMRRKVRGLRRLEQDLLTATGTESAAWAHLTPEQQRYARQIVFDYCAAVRGILNDNHGGPLWPAGWRMADALRAVCRSLEHNLAHPTTPIRDALGRLHGYIQRGLARYDEDRVRIGLPLGDLLLVWHLLHPGDGHRQPYRPMFHQFAEQFSGMDDPIIRHIGDIMLSFEDGLFCGGDALDIPDDNLALERWIKWPKGHERRIHGRQHVGLRMVAEAPTLLPALDVHLGRDGPFTVQDLRPYIAAEIPESQQQAVARHRMMRQGSSKKNDRFC